MYLCYALLNAPAGFGSLYLRWQVNSSPRFRSERIRAVVVQSNGRGGTSVGFGLSRGGSLSPDGPPEHQTPSWGWWKPSSPLSEAFYPDGRITGQTVPDSGTGWGHLGGWSQGSSPRQERTWLRLAAAALPPGPAHPRVCLLLCLCPGGMWQMVTCFCSPALLDRWPWLKATQRAFLRSICLQRGGRLICSFSSDKWK